MQKGRVKEHSIAVVEGNLNLILFEIFFEWFLTPG
jgi:hypothetical protein